jgi:PhoPQ-activated pathogenicity-related protein
MGVVLPMTAMRLDDHDVTALEVLATDTAEAIIQALDPTAYERTQYNLRLLIKRLT